MYRRLDSRPVLGAARFLSAVLPRRAAETIAWTLGAAAAPLVGGPSWRTVANFAVTRYHLLIDRPPENVVEGAERLRGLDAPVFVSAHIGNWELGGAALAAAMPGLEVLAEAPRTAFSTYIESRRLPRSTHTCARLRRFVQETRAPVAALVDRGTAALGIAWMRGSCVVPVVVVLDGPRYRTFIERPIDARPRAGELRADGTKRLADEVRRVLQRYLERYPDQWFAFDA